MKILIQSEIIIQCIHIIYIFLVEAEHYSTRISLGCRQYRMSRCIRRSRDRYLRRWQALHPRLHHDRLRVARVCQRKWIVAKFTHRRILYIYYILCNMSRVI